MNLQQIKKTISQGKLGNALADLVSVTEGTEFYQQAILISSRFNAYQRECLMGILSIEEKIRQKNVILNDTLSFINYMTGDDQETSSTSSTSTEISIDPFKKSNLKAILKNNQYKDLHTQALALLQKVNEYETLKETRPNFDRRGNISESLSLEISSFVTQVEGMEAEGVEQFVDKVLNLLDQFPLTQSNVQEAYDLLKARKGWSNPQIKTSLSVSHPAGSVGLYDMADIMTNYLKTL